MEKLLLLSIADRCGEKGEAWPSISRLIKDTGLSKDSIIRHRNKLIQKGILKYTGEFKGYHNQVPVMQLIMKNYREDDESDNDIDQSQPATGSKEPPVATSYPHQSQPATQNLSVEPISKKEKINKKKKVGFSLETVDQFNPHNLPEQMILDWIEVRNAKKSPPTITGWNKLNKELSKCRNPIKAFEEAVHAGWIGFNPAWLQENKNKAPKESYYDNNSAPRINRPGRIG
jgi:hypothetical protein